MRSKPQFNFPAFRRATSELRARGYEVFSPAENDEGKGFNPQLGIYEGTNVSFSLRDALAVDLKYICKKADYVVVLPDWRDSRGVLAEVHAAWALGIPVYEIDELLDNPDDPKEITSV